MIEYPEGGIPGLTLRQGVQNVNNDTFKIQLVPLRQPPKKKISSPRDVVDLVLDLEDADRECAKILHLDIKNQVMGIETISMGSLSASIVHPRESLKGAILNNSASVIFIHNHPSGQPEPSPEDRQISQVLYGAFQGVGIDMLDSVIVGKGKHYSMREDGGMNFTPFSPQRKSIVSENMRYIPQEGKPVYARKQEMMGEMKNAKTLIELNRCLSSMTFLQIPISEKREIFDYYQIRKGEIVKIDQRVARMRIEAPEYMPVGLV